MNGAIVRIVDCPPPLQAPLREALLARDLRPAEAGERPADLIVMWLEPTTPDAAEAVARARDRETGTLPAVLLVGTEVSAAAIEAATTAGADAYSTAADPTLLAASCRLVAQAAARFAQASPLTGLPGNNVLQGEIERRLPERGELAILAFDVDEFKGYNDRYGYQRGDGLLRCVQAAVVQALTERAGPGWLATHLGGDDFVALVRPPEAEAVARRTIELFAAEVEGLYDLEDAATGCITVRTRRGEVRQLPLATLTVAAVTNEPEDLVHSGQLASVLAELKAYGKSLPGNSYVADRRRDHIVSPDPPEDATASPQARARVSRGTHPGG